MTDHRGTFEHARYTEPRREHGYCTDDMARVLVVAIRQPDPTPAVRHLADLSLAFLTSALGPDGCRNRMSATGAWEDAPTLEDCWGRSLWGLGTAAARSDIAAVRRAATAQLTRGATMRSAWPRAMAYAALGAAELLAVQPDHPEARALLADCADGMAPPSTSDHDWPWPEARLRYANAVLPEAMIAAGAVLRRPTLLREGLELLAWLCDHETRSGYLSVVGTAGAGPGDARPAFDQQPIEVAALADACARAAVVDPDPRWRDGVAAAIAWFLGANDGGVVMWDPATGGGFDGLEAMGVNRNQGAESTLAALSTLQHARRLGLATP